MPEENTVRAVRSDAEIRTTKIAACAVNLGCSILKDMIGNSVSKPSLDNGQAEEIMSAAITNELKL